MDFGGVSADELLNAYAAGQKLKAFYQPTYGQQFGFVVPEDSPITEWTAEQITGTTIGITELAGGEVPIARAALTRIGLTEGEDASFYPTSGDNQAVTVDAFNTGKIDIFAGSILDHAAVQVAGMELRAITPDFILNAAGDNARACGPTSSRRTGTKSSASAGAWPRARLVVRPRQPGRRRPPAWSPPKPGRWRRSRDFIRSCGSTGPCRRRRGHRGGRDLGQGWDDYQKLLLEGGTGSPDDPLTFTEPIDVNEIVDNSRWCKSTGFRRGERR